MYRQQIMVSSEQPCTESHVEGFLAGSYLPASFLYNRRDQLDPALGMDLALTEIAYTTVWNFPGFQGHRKQRPLTVGMA